MAALRKRGRLQLDQMQPIVLLGMHRSGTSLLSRLLMGLGIYMGSRLEENAESAHFQWMNLLIFASSGARWSNVEPLVQVMRSQEFVERQTKMMRRYVLLDNFILNRYIGLAGFFGPHIQKAVDLNPSFHWGWKDPRTTITFPIWLRLFPGAKCVHIIRNGVDVAISLNRRSRKQQSRLKKPLYYSNKTLSFDYCFHLWEAYVSFVLEYKQVVPSDQYLEMRYEDLLADPYTQVKRLANFLKYPVEEELLQVTCKQIRQDRLDNTSYALPYQDQIPILASTPLMRELEYSESCSYFRPLGG